MKRKVQSDGPSAALPPDAPTAKRQTADFASSLPTDIVAVIFEFLPPRTCARVVSLVCQRWHQVALRRIKHLRIRRVVALPPLPNVTSLLCDTRDWLPAQFFPHLRSLSLEWSVGIATPHLRYSHLTHLSVLSNERGALDELLQQNAKSLTSLRLGGILCRAPSAEFAALRSLELCHISSWPSGTLALSVLAAQLAELSIVGFVHPFLTNKYHQLMYPNLRTLWLDTTLNSRTEFAMLLSNAPQLREWHDNGPFNASCVGERSRVLASVCLEPLPVEKGELSVLSQCTALTCLTLDVRAVNMHALFPLCSRLRKLCLWGHRLEIHSVLESCAPFLTELDISHTVHTNQKFTYEFPQLRKIVYRKPNVSFLPKLVDAAPSLADIEIRCSGSIISSELVKFLRERTPDIYTLYGRT